MFILFRWSSSSGIHARPMLRTPTQTSLSKTTEPPPSLTEWGSSVLAWLSPCNLRTLSVSRGQNTTSGLLSDRAFYPATALSDQGRAWYRHLKLVMVGIRSTFRVKKVPHRSKVAWLRGGNAGAGTQESAELRPPPPVVTAMGHPDILDFTHKFIKFSG